MANKKNYPGYIEKHGSGFRVILTVKSRRYRFKAPNQKKAREIARKEYDRLARLTHDEEIRFSQVLSGFEEGEVPLKKTNGTKAAYRLSVKVFRDFFVEVLGDPLVGDLKPKHIKQFIRWRRTHSLKGSGEVSNRTIQRDRTVLHTVFEYARTEEFVGGNPVTKETSIDAEGREPVILADVQLEALLQACIDPMLRLYVLVLAETGLRCDSEALWLRWEDVDLAEGFLLVDTARKAGRQNRTKSGKTRHVPITKRLASAFREHMASFRFMVYSGDRSPWVFHHIQNRRHATAGKRIGCLRNGFNRAVRRAGLPPEINQHDLRHRRVTTWLEEGNPIHLVQQAMGHSDIKTTLGYNRFLRTHLRVLVEPGAADQELRKLVHG